VSPPKLPERPFRIDSIHRASAWTPFGCYSWLQLNQGVAMLNEDTASGRANNSVLLMIRESTLRELGHSAL
jgi:hypothetical protein